MATWLCLALFFPYALKAVEGKLYTSAQLSNSYMNSICQDRRGYIWIGSFLGLNRFDGYRFVSYYYNHHDASSIPDNNVSTIYSDTKGTLWIGFNRGFARYDYATDRFIRYEFPEEVSPRVTAIAENKRGEILVGTAGYGLFTVDSTGLVLRSADEYERFTPESFFSRLFVDSYGNLFTSSHRPVFSIIFTHEGKPTSCKRVESTCGSPVTFLQCDERMLLIVCEQGVLAYDYTTNSVSEVQFEWPGEGPLPLRSALLDSRGDLWMGTAGMGLMRVKKGTNRVEEEPLIAGKEQLSSNSVSFILEDKDHNLWINARGKGVILAEGAEPVFRNWSFSLQNRPTLGSVNSTAVLPDGGMLVSVNSGELYRFDAQGRLFGPIPAPPGISSVYADPLGRYWLSAANRLYSYDLATGKHTLVHQFESSAIGQMKGNDRGILFVSVLGRGFYEFNPQEKTVRNFHMNQDNRTGELVNNWVTGMVIDRQGDLWLATSAGLSHMTKAPVGKDYRFQTFLEDIPCDRLCEMENGDIAIASSRGLYLYDRKSNEVVPFLGSEVLENKFIYSIIKDAKGDLWLSTSRGIWHYILKEKRFTGHLNGHGGESPDYTFNTTGMLTDGRIYFGHTDGVTLFNPIDVMDSNPLMRKVHLSRFLHDGLALDTQAGYYALPYTENSFTLEVSLLDYRRTEHIRFEYRLNESDWKPFNDASNAITFNRMNHGTYDIDIRAEHNGRYSEEPLTLQVRILPPWYLSWWAILLYTLAAAALVYGALKFYARRQQVELDDEKMKFLMNATHDIRSPLTLILGPVQKLQSIDMERLKTEEDFRNFHETVLQPSLQTIDHNAHRLLLLVNQILDKRKIDKQQMQLHCRETDLVEFIGNICKLFQYNATQRNITFTFEHERDHVLAWIDRSQFDKVVNNLLSNAFKYTFDGGEVTITTSIINQKSGPYVQVRCIDSGVGFKNEKTEQLFERFYQGKTGESLGIQGTGIGLNLARSIIQLHGGRISATNRKDGKQGAEFTLTLPMGNQHLKPEQIMGEDTTRNVLTTAVPGQRIATRKYQVMMVDDDREVAEYLIDELSNWYRFHYFPNGKEALTALLADPKKYDLVISDVMMPELDGVALLKKIKQNTTTCEIPVILLTSKQEIEDKLEGLRRGADAYIIKPFNMQEVHIQIDNLISNVHRLRGKFTGARQQEQKVAPIKVKGNDDILMERIMRVVNERMTDCNFNVEDLATDVGISRAQLHRRMKEMTGIPAGQFLRNLRLEQAARLLREGRVNVSQIAHAVGFTDQAYFSTLFKSHFGMTPTDFTLHERLTADVRQEADEAPSATPPETNE